MSAVTIVALTLAVIVLWAVARGRREPPRDLGRSSASVDAERDKTEPPTIEPSQSAEPVPSERPRATIPPVVLEALASEPETARKSAPTPVPTRTPAPAPAPAPTSVAAAADRTAIEADDPERKKARKLARLVVSEIKLYNEKLVAEGLAAGDLYTRLKEPIDQSLIVFARRIPETVRAEFDYMHDEIVRQLAGGDVAKLGPNYERLRRS